MKVPFNVGSVFDFGKPLPNVDMAPEHYIDYHPAETQRQVDAMLSWAWTTEGAIDGKVWRNKLREFVETSPRVEYFVLDSLSPIA